jgi:polar amino acid transport system substrate-binding protein
MHREVVVMSFGLLIVVLLLSGCTDRQTPTTPPVTKSIQNITFLTEEYPPFNFAENGSVRGIAVDVLTEALSSAGVRDPDQKIRLTTWTEAYQSARISPYTAVFSTARTPAREDLFVWVGPLIQSETVIFMREGWLHANGSAPDISSLKYGVVQDDIAGLDLEDRGVRSDQVIARTDFATLVLMLEQGEIDAIAYAEESGKTLINRYAQNPGDITIASRFAAHDYYLAMNRETPASIVKVLQEAVDSVRKNLDASGTSRYQRIYYHYAGSSCGGNPVPLEAVIDLVNLTAQAFQKDAQGTISAINSGKAPYRDPLNPDLYIFVFDSQVNSVANADNPRTVGMNLRGKPDVNGTLFRDEIVDGALMKGSGTVEYVYTLGGQRALATKKAYYLLVNGSEGVQYIIGAATPTGCGNVTAEQ